MALTLKAPVRWINKSSQKTNITNGLIAFLCEKDDDNALRVTALIVAQVLVFIPLLALMVLYYHLQADMLIVMLILFIANTIANLGRPFHRVLVSIAAIAVINLLSLVLFIL